jgi:para-nitrobenzyl esterase
MGRTLGQSFSVDLTKSPPAGPEGNLRMVGSSNRRSVIAGASLFILARGALAQTSPAPTLAQADKAVTEVETLAGRIRGFNVAGINRFLGVPYGGPASGSNRFKPPVPVAPWTGVRDAFDYGPIAPQVLYSPAIDYISLIEWDQQPGGTSEDVLTLNVWTPGIGDSGKRPVLVSLHGGGFTSGSSGHSTYNGDPLSRYGNVVVVTVNHRLGALGYLDLADIGAPAEYAQAGVAGMLDIVQALQWVRDNIERFGGDPGTVMVFGQSGGGRKVSTLLAMPSGKGLFHRAAVQSGSQIRSMSREDGAKAANLLLRQLGLDRSRLGELLTMPWDRILAAQAALAAGPVHEFWPVVDGAALPQHPFDPTAPLISADIPLIVSNCLHDAALALTNFDLTDDGLKAIVVKLVGEAKAQKVLDLYYQAYPNATPFQIQATLITDRDHNRRAVTQAERKAASGSGSVWMYRFDWPSPGYGGKFGAVHATDVALVFHNAHLPIDGDRPVAHMLADKMTAAWVAFAKTGNPNTPDMPSWPPYTVERRETMVINTSQRALSDPGHAFRLLWNELG